MAAVATVQPRLDCQVETVRFDTVYRFFQEPPPVYFQKLNTSLRVGITNKLGKPIYIKKYSVAVLVGTQWVQFKNADSAAFEPFAFGIMGVGENNAYLRRFDLSENGFDYVMQQKPLKADESIELWMFFISGLSRKNLPEISQLKFIFQDSTGTEWTCISPYSVKDDKGTVVGINKGDLKAASSLEPIPNNLREEPPH